jgi:hypothetical protein
MLFIFMNKPEEVLILIVCVDVGREFINLLPMKSTCCTICYFMNKPEKILILVVCEDVGREFINLLPKKNTSCNICYLFYGQT